MSSPTAHKTSAVTGRLPARSAAADRHATLRPVKLGELIEKRAIELGGRRRLSYRELSARAKAVGYTLNETTINAWVRHPLDEPPRRRSMEALAVALDVDFPVVVQAVAESMVGAGVELAEVADAPHVRAWVTLTEGRSDAERAQMLDMMRSVAGMLDASRARETDTAGGDPDTRVTHIDDAGRSRRSRESR
jgi:hypothetical protein